MMQGSLSGTTFTGDPTRTTHGNTWRSYMYNHFIRHKANIPRSSFAGKFAGDDVKIFLESVYANVFYSTL